MDGPPKVVSTEEGEILSWMNPEAKSGRAENEQERRG